MYYKLIKVFEYIMLCSLMMACRNDPKFPIGTVRGYKPIYAPKIPISFESSRSIKSPGKICRYKNYLLISERRTGIHFFDTKDPSVPKPVGFLKIQNTVDMELKDSILIVDHLNDVVSLNIADLNSIKELSRIKVWKNVVPPVNGNYFECVDSSKGDVIGWEVATLISPKCYL